MLNEADRIFLTLEREQRAQNQSEIFETSSQPDLEEEVEEVEDEVEDEVEEERIKMIKHKFGW